MKKKALSILLCAIIALALLTITAAAEGEPDIWDGTADISWYQGGAVSDTYRITTAEQLAGLAQIVKGGQPFNYVTFELESDLDLGLLPWMPIGTISTAFQGNFSGNGHSITNLKVNDSENEHYRGLFGIVSMPRLSSTGGIVRDLNVSGEVRGRISGGIAGTTYQAPLSIAPFLEPCTAKIPLAA